jgi:hypothetical protein
VLINGRRLQPGDPSTPNPDINVIPLLLVDRVEVLTGGASSVYGADAVAGVVNFIMDTDFEGLRFDTQYSFYQHNNDLKDSSVPGLIDGPAGLTARGFFHPTGSITDGDTWDLSAAIGAGFDDGRGHVTAFATYRKMNAITQDHRDYSACASQARTPAQVTANGARLLDCGGSATSANGTVFVFDNFGTPGSTTFDDLPDRPEPHADPGLHAVQLRAVQLLPAAGRTLHLRRVRELRDQHRAAAVPRGDVHGRPLGRPDRPVGRLRQHADDQLRQPAAFGAAAFHLVRAGEPRDRRHVDRLSAGRLAVAGRAAGVLRSHDRVAV